MARGSNFVVKTEQYPDKVSSRTPQELPPNTKGLLYNDLKQCNGCGDCLPACPTKAIDMFTKTLEDNAIEVEKFSIDMGRCVFCGYCVSICPVQSLTFTKQYELSGLSPFDLIIQFTPEKSNKDKYETDQKLKRIRSYEVAR